MTTNTRYIDIDTDTRVGYNYIRNQYYVTNKAYTTYRDTLSLIREVLDALDIPQNNPSDEDIQALHDYIETLHTVYYTLQDNGSYIHTLQFNDFSQYPLTIDCEKAKLYIMNTTIIYDLTLNESPRQVRIPRLLSFYKDTCGLLIEESDMRYFYSLLLSYYNPACYNHVIYNETSNKYFYTNTFALSNFDKLSPATYICTYNPNNNADNTSIGYVVDTDTTTNTITLSDNIQESDLQGLNTIILKGTDTYIPSVGTTFSADGTYTIDTIQDNTIKVVEPIPFAYSFPYKECYVVSSTYTINSMNRDTRTITLAATPTDILVGDVILVSNAEVTTQYETISCNGTYTVEAIQENTITVSEEIPTDFTGNAILTKEIYIGNISKIRAKKLTLTDTINIDLSEGTTITVHTTDNTNTTIVPYTVSAYTTNTITVNEDIEPYNYITTCPQLYIEIPIGDTEVLVDITEINKNISGVGNAITTGEFMVDNFEQCIKYLSTQVGLVKPTQEIKDKLYKEVPSETELEEILDLTTSVSSDTIQCSIDNIKFLGVYSKIYTETQ